MADRGRDLKFSILSDISKFDTDKPARGLEDLADSATLAGDAVDKLSDLTRRADVDKIGDDARDAGSDLDRFASDARTTARKVDGSFDAIAKSSKANLRDKVNDDLDKASEGFDEFKDEAKSSGREAAASFGGGFDDVADTIQEIAANAFGGFGPLGLAAGIAAGAGIGIITKVFSDSKEKAEEAKAAIGDWVQAFIDGQGKIQEATIAGKLQDILGDPDQYKEITKLTRDAGVSASLYARALAGDTDAAKKLSGQLAAQSQKLAANTSATGEGAAAAANARGSIEKLATKLGIATGQVGSAKKAWELLDDATRAGITADVEVRTPTAKELANEAAQMKGTLGRPINVPVKIDADRAARIAWLDADRYFRQHPITIRTSGTGKRPIRDVP